MTKSGPNIFLGPLFIYTIMEKIHLILDKGKKCWFTSDLHFGHRNVLKFCNRPYSDEKVMGEQLVQNWNNTVGEDDIVFVLGDTFWFNDSRTINKVLSSLKGSQIYILPGNHDDFTRYHRVNDPRIKLCSDFVACWLVENENVHELWLSHYPMMTWPHRERHAYQLFGHIHSAPDKLEGVDQDLPLHWNQCDVGCDYWEYKPVELHTLLDFMNSKK